MSEDILELEEEEFTSQLSLCPKISWSIQIWSNGVVPFREQLVRM